jgi:hypothetical protein
MDGGSTPSDNPFAQPNAGKGGKTKRPAPAPAPAAYQPPEDDPTTFSRPNFDGGGDEEVRDAAGTAAPAAATGGAKGGRGAKWLLPCTACTRCVRRVGASHKLTMCSLCFAVVLALAHFAFSGALLGSKTQVGPGCDAATCDGASKPTCMALLSTSRSCANFCDPGMSVLAPFAPFTFSLPALAANPVFTADRWFTCPYPQHNVNWRVPLAFFTTLLCTIAALNLRSVRKGSRRTVAHLRSLLLLAPAIGFCGLLFFYVMIIDGAAADRGSRACASGFAAAMPGGTGVPGIECAALSFTLIVLLDFALVPTLLTTAAATWIHYRQLKNAPAGAPAAGASGLAEEAGGGEGAG